MVAPGAGFDFLEGPEFRARTHETPDLVEAIMAETRQRFDRFELLEPDLRIGDVIFRGAAYGFVVQRLPQSRMSLQWVWNKALEPMEKAAIEALLKRRRNR